MINKINGNTDFEKISAKVEQPRVSQIVILGSTGSIGENTLEVVRKSDGFLKIVGLVAGSNETALKKQAEEFGVANYILASEPDSGQRIEEMVSKPEVDIVVVAIVGFAALKPTVAALRAGKRVALANKEAFVTCGEILIHEAHLHKGQIIPVDSEHNSLFQALQGHPMSQVEKLWITGSGGPFRGMTHKQLEKVSIHS
jgi:1-deoxy-D-xylulose-5-phosphate reductoisomerase